MSKISQLVTQGGADTFTAVAIDTGLTADGKAGWQINAIRAFWVDGAAVAAADHSISAKVATIATTTTFGSSDEIDRVAWGLQNTAGVAVAVPYEPIKQDFLLEPRVTVQPNIYVQVESAGTAQANDVIFEIYYDVVKLSDLEVLRLLAGGA
jgi:hypothetical protein